MPSVGKREMAFNLFFLRPGIESDKKTGREPVREPPWGESDLIRPGGGRIAAGGLCALFTVGFLLHNIPVAI
jgi:hypothetical protein